MRNVATVLSWKIAIAMFLAPMLFAQAQTGPQGITLQGQLVDSSNHPVESSSVDFTVQVLSSEPEKCVLFEETHNRNMAGSNGDFTLIVGAGTRSGTAFKNTNTLAKAFSNSEPPMSSLECAAGYSSYAPASGHKRFVRLTFNDGTVAGNQVVDQDLPVQASPYALTADSLQGKGPSDFLQKNTSGGKALSQTNLESVFQSNSYVTELLALIGGTSTHYAKPQAGGQLTVATPVASTDATNKNYVDSRIGGSALDLTGLAAGQSLSWDGTKWVPYTPASSAPVSSVAGRTGTIVLTSSDIGGLGTAATKSVAASGDAASGEVVLGNDSRLTNSRAPSGAASGDLSGTYPGPTVAKLQGRAVSSTAPSTDFVLKWSGSAWTPSALDVSLLTSGTGKYFTYQPNGASCTDGQTLVWNATDSRWECGVAGGGGGGSVTSVGVTAPIVNSGTATAPVIGVSDASSSAKGVVQLAASGGTTAGQAVQASDARLSDSRAPSGTAAGAGSDLAGTYPSPTVARIRNNAVAAGTLTGTDTGKVYRWNGGTLAFEAAYLNFGDLKTSVGGQQFASSCSSSQTLTWSAVTDAFTCVSIGSLNASAITAGTLDAARMPALTGDVTTTAGAVATTIASNAVTSAKIADGTIAAADLADGSVTAAKLGADVGAWSVSSGDVSRATGKVGIGTTSPGANLDVSFADTQTRVNVTNTSSSTDRFPGFVATNYKGSTTGFPVVDLRAANGSSASPTALQTGNMIGSLRWGGYGATQWFFDQADITVQAGANWTDTSTPTFMAFSTTAAAATSPSEHMRITSAGNVGIGTASPTSNLHVNGSFSSTISAKSSNYTLTSTDNVITANASSGAITMTLPTAVGIAGRHYTIKKTDSSSYAVTIATTSGQTIDGSTSNQLSQAQQHSTVISDGSNWQVIGSNGATQTLRNITVKMWGAGGAGNKLDTWDGWQSGASGAYLTGTIQVNSGDVLTLTVGTGGTTTSGGSPGGGAAAYSTGGGGGLVAIQKSSTYVAIVGSGGGSAGAGGMGGAGGGLTGGNGTGSAGGFGGTQSAGGMAGCGVTSGANIGSSLTGGNGASNRGAGGGAGYWGGGGGIDCGSYGGGGGGSSLIPASTTVTNGNVTASTSTILPPSSGDSDYVTGVGVGGAANASGGPGLIVLYVNSVKYTFSNSGTWTVP